MQIHYFSYNHCKMSFYDYVTLVTSTFAPHLYTVNVNIRCTVSFNNITAFSKKIPQ